MKFAIVHPAGDRSALLLFDTTSPETTSESFFQSTSEFLSAAGASAVLTEPVVVSFAQRAFNLSGEAHGWRELFSAAGWPEPSPSSAGADGHLSKEEVGALETVRAIHRTCLKLVQGGHQELWSYGSNQLNPAGAGAGEAAPGGGGGVATGTAAASTTSSSNAAAGVGINVNGSNVLLVTGLPYEAVPTDVVNFFSGFNVEGGVNGVLIMQRGGPAYVSLGSASDAEEAIRRLHRTKMSAGRNTRPVEVVPSQPAALEAARKAVAAGNAMIAQVGPGPATGTALALTLRGIPFTSTEADIMGFFRGYDVVPGSVRLGLHADGRPSGEAEVTFASEAEASRALSERDRKTLGNRYVELYASSVRPLQRPNNSIFGVGAGLGGAGGAGGGVAGSAAESLVASLAAGGPDGHVVRLRGLPWSSAEADIHAFFAPLQLLACVMGLNMEGRPSGSAWCEFYSGEDKDSAMQRDKQVIGARYIDVLDATKSEMIKAANQNLACQRGMMNNNNRGGPNNHHQHHHNHHHHNLHNLHPHSHHPHHHGNNISNNNINSNNNHHHLQHRHHQHQHHQQQHQPHQLPQQQQQQQQQQPHHHHNHGSSQDRFSGYAPRGAGNQGQGGPQGGAGGNPLLSMPSGGRSNAPGQGVLGGGAGNQPGYGPVGNFLTSPVMPGFMDMGSMNMGMGMMAQPQLTVVKMRGVPYNVTLEQIMAFFKGFNSLVPATILLGVYPSGQPSGEAWASFASAQDAQNAVATLNKKYLGPRYVELNIEN